MSDAAKVILSSGELAMATDKNIILTKVAIIEKAFALFAGLVPGITSAFQPLLGQSRKLTSAVPKIYKGENYNGFPYVMMDYPAVFEKENIFAVRTMFWWGNFICITLHLSGEYKNYWEKNIFDKLKESPHFFVAINEDEWQHHFEKDNYVQFYLLNDKEKKTLHEKRFIKVALKYELHHWNMMQSMLPIGYKEIADLLTD